MEVKYPLVMEPHCGAETFRGQGDPLTTAWLTRVRSMRNAHVRAEYPGIIHEIPSEGKQDRGPQLNICVGISRSLILTLAAGPDVCTSTSRFLG